MKNTSLVIGIAGGSGSGKTTLATKAFKKLGPDQCVILSQDHYYKDQSHRFDGDGQSVNFDHPDAIDFDLLSKHILALKNFEVIQIPIYDFATHKRKEKTHTFYPKKIIIVEGTLILSQEKIRELFDLSFFIQTSEELRFARRLKRDTEERGRSPEGVKRQFAAQVKPMHDLFVEPSKNYANYIITNDNEDIFFQELLKAAL